MPKTTKERINNILFEWLGLEGSPDDIKPEDHIADELGADSVDEVEMVMAVEEEFDVHIPDEVCEQWKTVGDVYKHFEA